jgi:sugar-specific transcriptional regulator TrmB
MDTSILEKAGFTKGEIRVYLALLELGETTTGPIIDKSRISSSKVYEILDKLIQKGLVSYTVKNKTKYFQPASPNKIKEYLQLKKKEFEDTEKQIENLLPQLEEKQKSSEDSQTTSVYEGFEGIKSVFNQILSSLDKGEEYYAFTLDEEVTSEELKVFFLNYHTKRIQEGIKVKLLSNEVIKKKIKKKFPQYKLSERRFIDHSFPNGVFIFKNYVMHFIYKPKTTLFVIKSKQNFESYKKFFLELWNKATP